MRFALIALPLLALTLFACESNKKKESDPKAMDDSDSSWQIKDGDKVNDNAAKKDPAKKVEGAMDGAKKDMDGAMDDVSDLDGEMDDVAKKAEEGMDEMEDAGESIADEVADSMDSALDMDSILDGSMDADSIQGMIGSMSGEGLSGLASQITSKLDLQMEEVSSITEKLGAEGLTDTVKEQLQGRLDSLNLNTESLTGTLKSVVSKMSDGGLDVSSFSKYLGGS